VYGGHETQCSFTTTIPIATAVPARLAAAEAARRWSHRTPPGAPPTTLPHVCPNCTNPRGINILYNKHASATTSPKFNCHTIITHSPYRVRDVPSSRVRQRVVECPLRRARDRGAPHVDCTAVRGGLRFLVAKHLKKLHAHASHKSSRVLD